MAQCVVYLWFLTYSLPESTATLHSLMIFSKRCSKCSMSLSSLETNCLRGEKQKKRKNKSKTLAQYRQDVNKRWASACE